MKKLVKEKRSMRLSQEEMTSVAEIVGLDFVLIVIPSVRVGLLRWGSTRPSARRSGQGDFGKRD